MAQKKSKPLVVISNSINRASYRLSVVETRVVLSAISKIPRDKEVSPDTVFWVNAQDLMDLGSRQKDVYAQLRDAADTIFDRQLCFNTEEGYRRVRWVSAIDYEEGNSRVGLKFSADMLPYLAQVKSSFTKYPLQDVRGLKSEYAIRIYTMLLQFRQTGWMTVSIDDLRIALELQGKYKSVSLFKMRVLDMAVDQINASEYTQLTVSYELIRVGRAFKEIRFTFKEKRKGTIDTATIELPPTIQPIQLSPKQATMFANKLLDSEVWLKFYHVARPLGLNLLGVTDNRVSAQRVAKWLSDPNHAALVIDFLIKVGFVPPKTPTQPVLID